MTKADLVEEVVRVAELSKKQAEAIVNTVFLARSSRRCKHDDKIELRGFGSFRVPQAALPSGAQSQDRRPRRRARRSASRTSSPARS